MHHTAPQIQALDHATNLMLGPQATRMPDQTEFEAMECSRQKRCYSLGTAVQQSRRVIAHSAYLDQELPNIMAYQTMAQSLPFVSPLPPAM